MSRAAERRRRLAHTVVPLLFLAAVTVLVLLVRAGLESGSTKPASTTATTTRTPPTTHTTSTRRRPRPRVAGGRFYTVQTGDTFNSIAAKTGVSVSDLERLNPGVSSNALQVGEKLRVQ